MAKHNKKAKAKAKAIKGGMPQNVADRVFKMTPGKPGRKMTNSTFAYKDEQVMAQMGGFGNFLKKAGRTALQAGKDVAYQAMDLLSLDPVRVGGTGSREAGDIAKDVKLLEKKNFDKSRQLKSQGKTFFSLANAFDDSGYGNILGTNEKAKRKLPSQGGDLGDATWTGGPRRKKK